MAKPIKDFPREIAPPEEGPLGNTPPAPPPESPRASRKPVPADLKITARQYVRIRQYRWERSTGFLLESRNKFGAHATKTRPEWDVEWDAFWTRPV